MIGRLSAPARIGGFVLVLAVVFGLAVTLGARVGTIGGPLGDPVGDPAPVHQHPR